MAALPWPDLSHQLFSALRPGRSVQTAVQLQFVMYRCLHCQHWNKPMCCLCFAPPFRTRHPLCIIVQVQTSCAGFTLELIIKVTEGDCRGCLVREQWKWQAARDDGDSRSHASSRLASNPALYFQWSSCVYAQAQQCKSPSSHKQLKKKTNLQHLHTNSYGDAQVLHTHFCTSLLLPL